MERIKQEQQLQTVAQLLIQSNLISKIEIIEYQHAAQSSKQTLLRYLISKNLFSAQQLALLLSEHFGISYFDLDSIDFDLIPWQLIDEKLMRRLHVVPVFIRGNHLFLALDDPSSQASIKEAQFHTGLYSIPIVVEAPKLTHLIERICQRKLSQGPTNYLETTRTIEHIEITTSSDEMDTSVNFKEDAPIVKFVNKILLDAIKRKVSDIHFEPYEDSYRIRYRLDGVLVEAAVPANNLANRITARIKIISNLDIAERRIPQDGRFKMRLSDTLSIDFRVNVCPTVNGEKVVVRILNPDTPKIDIEELGFNAFQKKTFLAAIEKPQGMILVTGPTGSGKTVSLYTALALLNTDEKNISTAEDPVEIKITGINQVNIKPKVGLTFANTLRSFLRQDPDIIMVGEIRDLETAEIAIKAAHTGHLVLSTVHTNSAAETLTRLNNMGIAPFHIASSISLIIAQRLVRRLCEQCKLLRDDLSTKELTHLGLSVNTKLYKACGCKQCISGYSGRIGLFEMMPISSSIANLIIAGNNSFDIFQQAQAEGMLTLYDSGIEKVRQGITTIEELNRVIVN